MAIKTQVVKRLICDRCKWEWQPRGKKLPKVCPKCKREDWNGKRKRIKDSLLASE